MMEFGYQLPPAYSKAATYARDVCHFLAVHSWVYDFQLTRFFVERVWERMPMEWRDVLCQMEIAKLNDLPFSNFEFQDFTPSSLKDFIQQSQVLSLPRQQATYDPVTLDKDATRGMNPKKVHEVCQMASVVQQVCLKKHCSAVVDVGAGLGYLGQVLNQHYGLRVIGLESKTSNTHGAQARLAKQDLTPSEVETITMEVSHTREFLREFFDILDLKFGRLEGTFSECSSQKHVDSHSFEMHVPSDDLPTTRPSMSNCAEKKDRADCCPDRKCISTKECCNFKRDCNLDASAAVGNCSCAKAKTSSQYTSSDSTVLGAVGHFQCSCYNRHFRNHATSLGHGADPEVHVCSCKMTSGDSVNVAPKGLDPSPDHLTFNKSSADSEEVALSNSEEPQNTSSQNEPPAVCTEIKSHVNSPDSRVCLVGLHSCGSLTPSMLKLFVDCSRLQALACVSCCYHNMNVNEDGFPRDFPLSQVMKEALSFTQKKYRSWNLSIYALRLAAQETRARWKSQSEDDHVFHSKNVAYRGLLELFMCEESQGICKEKRKLARKKDFANFESYLDAIFGRSNIEGAQDTTFRLKQLYFEYEKYFCFIEPITALQVLLQPVLESLLLIDRILFLEEHGVQASLVPVFNEYISPRNMAIVATR